MEVKGREEEGDEGKGEGRRAKRDYINIRRLTNVTNTVIYIILYKKETRTPNIHKNQSTISRRQNKKAPSQIRGGKKIEKIVFTREPWDYKHPGILMFGGCTARRLTVPPDRHFVVLQSLLLRHCSFSRSYANRVCQCFFFFCVCVCLFFFFSLSLFLSLSLYHAHICTL